jgi:uncharacterized protein (TIRG00374 family)
MKKQLQIWGGLLLGAGILYVMLRSANWTVVGHEMQSIRIPWLAAAVAVTFVSLVTRTKRWTYIVRAEKPVAFRHVFSAMQIGFMANFTLPLRLGEIIRPVVLSHLTRIPFSKCMAFAALDRVTDLFGLIFMLLVTALTFHPTKDIELPAQLHMPPLPAGVVQTFALSTVAVSASVIAAFVVLYLKQELVIRLTRRVLGGGRLANTVAGLIEHFADGLHVFRSTSDMANALLWSLITWMLCGVSFHLAMLAFGLDPPWYTMFLTLSMLSILISAPGAPGMVGQFHAGILVPVLLLLPGTPYDRALAIAIVAHLITVVLTVTVGIVCIYRENLGLRDLSREASQIKGD